MKVSFEEPEYTANSDALGTLRLLEAIRIAGLENVTRFYQASTSKMYGLVQEIPLKETTAFYHRSPYAVAKLYAYWITVNYREAYASIGRPEPAASSIRAPFGAYQRGNSHAGQGQAILEGVRLQSTAV